MAERARGPRAGGFPGRVAPRDKWEPAGQGSRGAESGSGAEMEGIFSFGEVTGCSWEETGREGRGCTVGSTA